MPYVRRIMLESRSFAVLPSLGALADGHSLVCPKSHVRSFAQLDHGQHDEFLMIKRDLTRRLGALYGREVHVFEHGMGEKGRRVLCTVDHAHMHFVPLPRTIALDTEGWITFDGSLTALRQLASGHEYVFYETADGVSRVLVSEAHAIESQYMRKVIAAGLGHGGHWNWRVAPNARVADEGWRRFVSLPLPV